MQIWILRKSNVSNLHNDDIIQRLQQDVYKGMCHSPYYQQCIGVVKILMFPKKDNFTWNVLMVFKNILFFLKSRQTI